MPMNHYTLTNCSSPTLSGTNNELVERLNLPMQQSWHWIVYQITEHKNVRSSMDNIAGYRAVVEAANAYAGFFVVVTAAGKVFQLQFIIGAGLQDLQQLGQRTWR